MERFKVTLAVSSISNGIDVSYIDLTNGKTRVHIITPSDHLADYMARHFRKLVSLDISDYGDVEPDSQEQINEDSRLSDISYCAKYHITYVDGATTHEAVKKHLESRQRRLDGDDGVLRG